MAFLSANGLATDSGYKRRSGFVEYPMVMLNLALIYQHFPKAFQEADIDCFWTAVPGMDCWLVLTIPSRLFRHGIVFSCPIVWRHQTFIYCPFPSYSSKIAGPFLSFAMADRLWLHSDISLGNVFLCKGTSKECSASTTVATRSEIWRNLPQSKIPVFIKFHSGFLALHSCFAVWWAPKSDPCDEVGKFQSRANETL